MDVQLSWLAFGIYAAAFIFFLVAFMERRRGRSVSGIVVLSIGLAVHLVAIVIRAEAAGHLPFASRFEALVFYALVTAALALVLSLLRRDLPIAFLCLPLVLVFLLGALTGKARAPHPLPPVLNSPFFLVHVLLAFAGYGIYTVNLGLAVGALFAIREPQMNTDEHGPAGNPKKTDSPSRYQDARNSENQQTASPGVRGHDYASGGTIPNRSGSGHVPSGSCPQRVMSPAGHVPSHEPQAIPRLGSVEELLGLARRLVPWGLLTLGAGIALGGIWALFSWGTWWGWDPKETGALVTWLSYVAYVHSPSWPARPRKAEALLPIFGYLLLLVTFLGINLLKWGVHAYQ